MILNMSNEQFDDAVQKVCDLIFKLTIAGRGIVQFRDIKTYEALSEVVYRITKNSVEAMMKELEREIEKGNNA